MKKHLTLLVLTTLVEISLSTVVHHAQAAALPVRTVALSGQPALGAPSGMYYDTFVATSYFSPVLNDAGRTAFFSTLIESGMAVASGTGVWSEGAGSLSLMARTDASAPGTPSGVNFRDFINSRLVLNNSGQLAFFAGLSGSGVDITNEQSIWSGASGSLALVARDRNAAPGTPAGAFFSGLSRESLVANELGQIAFVSYLGGTGVNNDNNRGVWSSGSGSLSLIARAETHAPGTPDGVRYSTFGGTLINDAGQVAFGAGITGPGVSHLMNEATDIGIWSQGTGSLSLVARAGSHAPGTPSGVIFREFRNIAFNNAGHIAFDATLRGPGVEIENESGIWSESSGSLAPVARAGSLAPGAASGATFSTFNTLLLNNAGQIAFSATLADNGMDPTKNAGIWSDVSGSLAPLALNGQPAPGTPAGVNFGAPVSGPHFGGALNNAGQIAFAASLTGSGVDFLNDRGIWATDHTGALQLIARTGDLLEVAPANFRTIRELYFVAGASNSDGRPSGFNNRGQLAFWARFTDGSQGVFVSNRVLIAEPTSVALLALGLPLIIWRSSRCTRVRRSNLPTSGMACRSRARERSAKSNLRKPV